MKKSNYIVLSILVIVSITLLWVQSKFITINSEWYTTIGNLASALLVCGVISLLQEFIIRKETDAKLAEMFKISMAIKDSGLQNILTDSNSYNYKDLIIESKYLYTIMNDGLRWVETNSPALLERFGTKDSSTEFFLVDPEGHFADALAQKTERELASLKSKIQQSVDTIKETYHRSDKKGSLCIYFLKNYPTQSVFYTERKVIVTNYQTACGRNTVPLYEYRYKKDESNIAKYLYRDLDNVRAESKLIFDTSREAN